jgi:FkbM family methyltransferase
MTARGQAAQRSSATIRLGLFGAAVAVVFTITFLLRFELIGAAMFAAGRSTNGCTWNGAVSSLRAKHRQWSLEASIAPRMKLLETDGGFERWQTPDGSYWTPRGKSNILVYNLAERERGVYFVNGLGVKKGQVVLDCGANMGVFTREALTAGASHVLAIEPVPENIECLRRTFATEIAAGKVTVVEKGVWDREDVLEMFQHEANNAAHSFVVDFAGAGAKLRLPLTTIDRIVQETAVGRVDYIKMDIEGAERQALSGAAETIRRYHPAMAICVYHLEDDPQVIPARVFAAWSGYRQYCGSCIDMDKRFRPEIFFYH